MVLLCGANTTRNNLSVRVRFGCPRGGCGLVSLAIVMLAVMCVFPCTAREVRIGVWRGAAALDDPGALELTVNHLNKALPAHTFVLKDMSREELARAASERTLDFAVVDPALYLDLEARFGAERLAMLRYQMGDRGYTEMGGVLLVRRDAPKGAGIEALHGGTLAVANRWGLGSWYACICELMEAHGPTTDFFGRIEEVATPRAVLAAVASGSADAGFVQSGALERWVAEGVVERDAFRVLSFVSAYDSSHLPLKVSTPLYPGWCFTAFNRVPDDLASAVVRALLEDTGRAPPFADRPSYAGWALPRSLNRVHECLAGVGAYPYRTGREVTFAFILREYMYWFIVAGAAMVIMLITTSYVTRLNIALRQEINVRKQAEADLRQSVERFEHIVACSGDWIWETDGVGRYTYTSAIVEEMLGYPPEQVLGTLQSDYFTASEREKFLPRAASFYARQERIFREQFRLVSNEGRVVIHQVTAEPVMNGRGELVGYRGVNRDVTKEVRFVSL
ncbi:MAG: PAS domain S-box protein [Spartobacteria bacterium]|nr:PAS domain S-box protein [Spartobacteria bacterium]